MDKPFQRKGSESNAHVGRDFESKIQKYFALQKLPLTAGISVPIGINGKKIISLTLAMKKRKFLLNVKLINGQKVAMSQVQNLPFGMRPCSSFMLHHQVTGKF